MIARRARTAPTRVGQIEWVRRVRRFVVVVVVAVLLLMAVGDEHRDDP
jgi:hypothetical protein